MVIKKKNKIKLQQNEEKGDKYLKKKNFKKALQNYRKVLELDENYLPVYDKLIEAHTKIKSEWSDADFSDSLSWTMKKQELENPQVKRIHAQLEPEWKEVFKLIQQLMAAKDEKSETDCVEKIAVCRDKAVYPLIEVLLSFKKLGSRMKSEK